MLPSPPPKILSVTFYFFNKYQTKFMKIVFFFYYFFSYTRSYLYIKEIVQTMLCKTKFKINGDYIDFYIIIFKDFCYKF